MPMYNCIPIKLLTETYLCVLDRNFFHGKNGIFQLGGAFCTEALHHF